MSDKISLQDQFAPNLMCFGCGPANDKGLQIKSHVAEDGQSLLCCFTPQPHQIAFPGIVNGGIIGVLLDCHMNWTAAWHLMQQNEMDRPPCSVTAEFRVMFEKPTPTGVELELAAWVDAKSGTRKAMVNATVVAGGETTARSEGVFVAVKEGHPAFHRW